MKLIMAIPTYWARLSGEGWQPGDAIYDHPIPLDEDGTLGRTIASLDTLKDRDFELVVLVCPTTNDIGDAAEAKVSSIIETSQGRAGIPITLFGPSHLSRVHGVIRDQGMAENIDLLNLVGYSNIRNLCQFVPFVMGADVALLIDDDEVFEDPDFIGKAREFIGRGEGDNYVGLVAGYYLQPEGRVLVGKNQSPWMKTWGQYDALNQAFEQVINRPPRLKPTPFVFGGNMLIHRSVTAKVPFDPWITRGEDIDFLMNAKMFGYDFYLDNELAIKHLPPPKTHAAWRQHREDVIRFSYQREKLRQQRAVAGMVAVTTEDFMPYPGRFLGGNLELLVSESAAQMAAEYAAQDDTAAAEEARRNIEFIWGKLESDPFQHLCELQRRWQTLTTGTQEPLQRKKFLQAIVES